MKARGRLLVTVAALSLLTAGAAGAQQPPPPAPLPVGAGSGILLELESGKILWAKEEAAPRPPASLTKILTALVVLERADLDEAAPITREARSAPGSRTYAEVGWTFSIRDHLWGLLLQSGNDSAIALAQKVGPDGTVAGFMTLANEKARRIGAQSTNFVNPHGYDEPGHLTTARDLALMTVAAMREPTFAEMVAAKTHNVTWGDGNPHTYINHNRLLWRYPGAIGVKTGFTGGAGHGLAAAARRGDATLVSILLASPDHYGETIALLDWAFANLPALRAAPLGVIRPAVRAEGREESALEGLEIVQIDPGKKPASRRASPSLTSAPLLSPLLALAGALGIAALIARRRRSESLAVELERILDAAEADASHPEKTEADASHPEKTGAAASQPETADRRPV